MGDTEHGGALFLATSYTNHSCDPNSFFFIVGDILHVRTIRDVHPGEEISITYLGGPRMDLYRSTHERRQLLDHSYRFECLCDRCATPSTPRVIKDSKIDGILCPIEGCGHIVRWAETGEEGAIEWRCTAAGCPGMRDHDAVFNTMIELETLYLKQIELADSYRDANQEEIMLVCNELLERSRGFLHPYHRFLARTYAHCAQFEPSDRYKCIRFLEKHIEAVAATLGDPHPAIIDDFVFLSMLVDGIEEQTDAEPESRNPNTNTNAEASVASKWRTSAEWLEEARKRYDIMFGLEGRPFEHHVSGLRRSVSAPKCVVLTMS